jgi:hypothetical protein
MKKIGLLSDTHGRLNDRVFHYFEKCDEIWHENVFPKTNGSIAKEWMFGSHISVDTPVIIPLM